MRLLSEKFTQNEALGKLNSFKMQRYQRNNYNEDVNLRNLAQRTLNLRLDIDYRKEKIKEVKELNKI